MSLYRPDGGGVGGWSKLIGLELNTNFSWQTAHGNVCAGGARCVRSNICNVYGTVDIRLCFRLYHVFNFFTGYNMSVNIIGINPLVPDAHYSERQDKPFSLQIQRLEVDFKVKLRIFISFILGTNGLISVLLIFEHVFAEIVLHLKVN